MAKGYISKIRLKHRKLQAKHQSLKTNTFYVDLGSSHPCQGLIIEFTSQSLDFLILLGHMTCLGQQKGAELMVLPFQMQTSRSLVYFSLSSCVPATSWIMRRTCPDQLAGSNKIGDVWSRTSPDLQCPATSVQISHAPAYPIHRSVRTNTLEPLSFIVIHCAKLLQQ